MPPDRHIDLARIGLGIGDELGNGFGWKRWVYLHDERHADDARDRRGALAMRDAAGSAAAPAARYKNLRRGSFMALPLRLGPRHRCTRHGGEISTALQDEEIDGAAGSCVPAGRQAHGEHRTFA